jgi:hypothetical protein
MPQVKDIETAVGKHNFFTLKLPDSEHPVVIGIGVSEDFFTDLV